MIQMKRLAGLVGLTMFLGACGTSVSYDENLDLLNDVSTGVETDPIRAVGLLSAIPTFALKKDGAYAPLTYGSSSALELIECSSDSPLVLVGCSVEDEIVHVSAVALSGADTTSVHFQVKNQKRSFARVAIRVVAMSTCQEIAESGMPRESSVYLLHSSTDAPGMNTEVACNF